MSTCYCGRTTRPPFCDGSHWLSDEEYKERTEKLNKLFKKEEKMIQKPNWVEQVCNSIPDHSKNIADFLKESMNTTHLTDYEKNGIAFVSAVCSGNGELAFEIEMSSLEGEEFREKLKGICSEMSVRNKIQDMVDMVHFNSKGLNTIWTKLNDINPYFKYTDDSDNYIYCYACSVAQSSKTNIHHYSQELVMRHTTSETLDTVVKISALVSSINKITL